MERNTIKFSVNGDIVDVVSFNNDQVFDHLEPRIYSVGFNDNRGFFLKIVKENFHVPYKIYGNVLKRAEKIIHTYSERESSTGVLLTGDKGAGKTMLTTVLCNKLIDEGMPIILVNNSYTGDDFFNLINSIGECVILIDEFAKVYRGEDYSDRTTQDRLLTLMDGTGSNKRLVLLTENEEYHISDYMINRPGRIYYHFRYKKLPEDVIKEMSSDNGLGEKEVNDIIDMSRMMFEFSYDTLKSIVEEWKRYGGKIIEIVEDLNIENPITMSKVITFTKIVLKPSGEELKMKPKGQTLIIDNPNDYSGTIVVESQKRERNKSILGHEYTGKYEQEQVGYGEDCHVESNKNIDIIRIWNSDVVYQEEKKIVFEHDNYIVSGTVDYKNRTNSQYYRNMYAF